MASTSWKTLPSAYPTLQIRVNYSSMSRTNNTVTVNGISASMKIITSGGYDGFPWTATVTVDHDGGGGNTVFSGRQVKGTTTATYGVVYTSSSSNKSFSVGANDTSGYLDAWGYSDGVGGGVSAWDLNIPDLGSPAGTTTIQSGVDETSIPVRNNVTTWGSNATSGSVRSYIADNSGFSGQTYIGTTDNALVTHTGLNSNDRYWLRGWCSNGGGKTAYMSTVNTVTLPLAPVAGTVTAEATTATVPTTLNSGGGYHAITTNYRLREAGGAWGAWTAYTTDVALTGLLPNTDYEVELQSVTSAGTTDGGVVTAFTTLPAGKLKYSDGTVVNAIPRKVVDGQPTEMVNINIIDPAP